jgi:hypothetical protein
MALQGDLQHMGVADLIQHNCQDGKTGQLTIEHNQERAALFFKAGNVVHATLGQMQGEEVVYRILSWEQGHFKLESGVQSPATTITRSWSGLLLQGAQRLDEANQANQLSLTQPEGKNLWQSKKEVNYWPIP